MPLIITVSPYHLTTREAPALASALLADRVVTLLPSPVVYGSDASRARAATEAAGQVHAYARLAKSWQWATPLFDKGIFAVSVGSDSPGRDLARVWELLDADTRYTPLSAFIRRGDYDSQDSYLAAVSADILKGGPDPGIAVPVHAAMDRFAVRTGALVARSAAVSVAQSVEARLGSPVFAVAIPVLIQADAERILLVRGILEQPLSLLRKALSRAASQPSQDTDEDVRGAADQYAAMFDRKRTELFQHASDDEVRPVEGMVMASGLSLPSDAALRSSVEAMSALRPRVRGGPVDSRDSSTPNAPALHDEAEGRRFMALIVKVMGARR